MNTKLVESLAQIIQSLTPEEQAVLEEQIKAKRVQTTREAKERPLYEIATPQERSKAFREWVESHQGRNYPQLSDADISRESIYGERG